MPRLLIWALSNWERRKTLHMFLCIMAGAERTGRLERFRNMLAQYAQGEINYLPQVEGVEGRMR